MKLCNKVVNAKEKIAVTGAGWVTPFAAGGIRTILERAGSLGLRGGPAPSPGGAFAAVGDDIFSMFPKLPGEAAKEDGVRLAAIALELARGQAFPEAAGLPYPPDRRALLLGCALAGVSGMINFANDVREQSPRFVSPIRFPQTVGNYISGALARGYDFRGPATTIACGSASSLEALRQGCALLGSGQADVVFVGGTERFSPELVEGLNQPDVRFADGACIFVIERQESAERRSAQVLASIGCSSGGADSSRGGSSRSDESLESVEDENAKPIMSTAGLSEPGAVFIEDWTGRTLGADGAAALAAAIGAAAGQQVPVYQKNPNVESSGPEGNPQTETLAIRHSYLFVRAIDDNGMISELVGNRHLPS